MAILTFQPTATLGKDTFSDNLNPDTNFGTSDTIGIRWFTATLDSHEGHIFIQVSPIGRPGGAAFTSATLQLYCRDGTGTYAVAACTADVQRISESWAEDTLTWNSSPAVAGAVLDSVVIPTQGSLNVWISFDITDAVSGWLDGSFPNYGVRIVANAQTDYNARNFYPSDHATALTHPKLIAIYGKAEPRPVLINMYKR